MNYDLEKLAALAEAGYLRSQRHPDADYWIYNYTEKAQYEGKWTAETRACRGLILDAEGQVIARPFEKFFNYGDPQVGELPAEPFTVTEKIDGSLGILYRLPSGEPRIATRGSFDSEQAIEATKMLGDYDWEARRADTPLFEIVYPENRIVVDYGSRRELVLLAVLENDTGRESAMGWGGPIVEHHDHDDIEAMRDHDRPNCEGYVVAFESGLRVKIKHPEYVRLHKLITGVNARHIWEILKDGGDLDSMLDGIPDELYGWISGTRETLLEEYAAAEARAVSVFDARPFDADRKTLALYFKDSDANPAVLFRMLDAKPYDDLIWKAIRPEPLTPDTIWTRSESPHPETGAVGA